MATNHNQSSKEIENIDDEKSLQTLVDFIDKDVETLVSMRMQAEQEVNHHQRRIEKITANLGRPRFLYFILGFVLLWVVLNIIFSYLGKKPFDPPPFYWLEGFISLSALLMTLVILITQNRQGKITEQRRHIDLTITLLTERKVSKLIELVKELRRDMPMVKDRHDPQAEMLTETANPAEVLTSFNRAMGETPLE